MKTENKNAYIGIDNNNENNSDLVSEIEIHYKSKIKADQRQKISKSLDCQIIFKQVWDQNTIDYKECFYSMYLNRNNKILGILKISEGGISGTVADIRIIFQGALMLNACNLIICHNHPSGNVQPSESDIALSRKIRDAGNYLDIKLLDSLIISSEDQYYSMADEGQI